MFNWNKSVKKRDQNMCRRCGFDKYTHAHHIIPNKGDYNIGNKTLYNGITLCGNCHSLLKGKETQTDLRGFLHNDRDIDKQLKYLLTFIEDRNIKIPDQIKEHLRGDKAARHQRAKSAYEIAEKRIEQARYKEAIGDYEEAIRHRSDDFRAYFGRGLAKSKLRYYRSALSDYDRAICLNPDTAYLYHFRGTVKRHLQNYIGAITDYDMYIKLSEKNVNGYKSRGFIKELMGEYKAAITDYDKAIEVIEDYDESLEYRDTEAVLYWIRGRVKLKLEEYYEADEDFSNAEAKGFTLTALHYRLWADACCGFSDWEGALYYLDDAIKLKDDDPTLYTYRAELYHTLREYEDSINDYNTAIELNPNDAETYLARGLVKYEAYCLDDREDEAYVDLDTAFKLKPTLRSEDNIDKSILNYFNNWETSNPKCRKTRR